jgi:hypothetical protein
MDYEISTSAPVVKKGKVNGLKTLIREVQSDNEDEVSNVLVSHADMSKSWRIEFKLYLETLEAALASGMSIIQWWGVRKFLLMYFNTLLTVRHR